MLATPRPPTSVRHRLSSTRNHRRHTACRPPRSRTSRTPTPSRCTGSPRRRRWPRVVAAAGLLQPEAATATASASEHRVTTPARECARREGARPGAGRLPAGLRRRRTHRGRKRRRGPRRGRQARDRGRRTLRRGVRHPAQRHLRPDTGRAGPHRGSWRPWWTPLRRLSVTDFTVRDGRVVGDPARLLLGRRPPLLPRRAGERLLAVEGQRVHQVRRPRRAPPRESV